MPLKFPLQVKKSSVVCTCSACPSQWEAKTKDGEYVYIRYRHGYLSVEVAPSKSAWYDNDWKLHFGSQLGDEYDGSMAWASVVKNAHIMEI